MAGLENGVHLGDASPSGRATGRATRRAGRGPAGRARGLVPLALMGLATLLALAASGCESKATPTGQSSGACTAFATAACERADRCGDTSATPCLSTAEQVCHALFERADSGITPQAIEQCAEATRASQCDEQGIPACLIGNTPGTRAEGAPCSVPSQCASGLCSAPPWSLGSVCGECQPALELGADCTAGTTPCRGDLVCRSDTGTCGPRLAPGDPCANFFECGLALCVSGVCEAVAGDGEPCTLGELCASGYGCDMGTCKKLTPVGAGEVCDPTLHACIDGVCSGGTCVPFPKQGEACEGACVVGLVCLGGTCQAPAPTDC